MQKHQVESASVLTEDGITLIAFDSNPYILFQFKDKFDAQEKELGMDQIYIEYGSQSSSQYGGIEKVVFENNTIKVTVHQESLISKTIGETKFLFAFRKRPECWNKILIFFSQHTHLAS